MRTGHRDTRRHLATPRPSEHSPLDGREAVARGWLVVAGLSRVDPGATRPVAVGDHDPHARQKYGVSQVFGAVADFCWDDFCWDDLCVEDLWVDDRCVDVVCFPEVLSFALCVSARVAAGLAVSFDCRACNSWACASTAAALAGSVLVVTPVTWAYAPPEVRAIARIRLSLFMVTSKL